MMGSKAKKFFGEGKKAFEIPVTVGGKTKSIVRIPARTTYHPNYYYMSGRNDAVKQAIAEDLKRVLEKARKSGEE